MKILVAACFIGVILSACNKDLANINHIVHMGQSLGAGEQSLPIVTDSATGYGNLKFSIGTHTWTYNNYPDKPNLRNDTLFNFVSLAANRRVVEGETIANGLCDHFTETAKLNRDAKLLFSYAGQGGRYLRELDKVHDHAKDPREGKRQSKGGYYKTSIDDVKRAKKVADSLGLTYSVLAITWMQGEANGTKRLNRWGKSYPRKEFLQLYKNDLIRIKNDYDNDISNILEVNKKIPFFTYQTAGTLAGTAQLSACNEEPGMYMIGPTYMLPNAENSFYKYRNAFYHGDSIHLTADGERWLGEMFGKVIRRAVVEGENWRPLSPTNAYVSNNYRSIIIDFHVPNPPIVVDTIFLPKQDNLNDYGNTILTGETKDLKNGIPFKEGQFCSISRRYSYGNLRDSDDEKSTFTFGDKAYGHRYGQQYPLWNWCVSFQDLKVEKGQN